ncbi:MAG: prolyl oligopeptidase family serine peptidase [Nibricoccus sp.]
MSATLRFAMHSALRLLPLGLLCAITAYSESPPQLPALTPIQLVEFEIPPVGTAAPGRFYNLFRPFRTEAAALSPDGKLLAYSIREGDSLYVITVEVDNPSHVLAKILAGTTKTSTPILQPDLRENTPARIRWMGWATPTRLLIETNANLAMDNGGVSNTSGAIFGVNADGSNARTLVTPRDVSSFENVAASTASFFSKISPSSGSSNYLINTPDYDQYAAQLSGPVNRASSVVNHDNDLPLDTQLQRSPTFFDYAPGEPDWIVVRTSDSANYSLYRVNIHSGKLRYGSMEVTHDPVATLINRQGLIGCSIPNTMRTSFPHSFQIAKNSLVSLGRWKKLSTIVRNTPSDFTVTAGNFFGERSFPLGFDENPDLLYYASNVGRDTYAVYGLDLKTGERAGKTIESPDVDLAIPGTEGFAASSPLVFDRYTRQLIGVRYQNIVRSAVWLRPDLQDAQASMEKTFPGRSVDILEWDETASRFLAIVRSPTEPGSFYVFDRTTRKASEFARRSDLPPESEPRFTRYFTIDNPAGGQLTGVIIIPNAVRQKPIPTIVMCADEPWQPTPAEFDGEINALVQMGFAVVQINPRGTWGFGARYRASAGVAFDEAQTADIVTAIDALAKTVPIHPQRVAIMGRDRGGFLALRAAQLRPDRFRCAIGINPTINLANWISYARWTTSDASPELTRAFFGNNILKTNPLMDDSKPLKRPVFVLSYRGSEGGSPTKMYLDARWFTHTVENSGTPTKFWTLSLDYMHRMPEARSEVMRNIEDFLNLNIYSYNVELGDAGGLNENTGRYVSAERSTQEP